MFHTILTLAYILPNIYIFLRIGKLFINKKYRFYYVLVYLFITLFFPIVNLFSDSDSGIVGEVANYLLPFYLYLFLSVLLFDIVLLVNRYAKIIPSAKINSTGFKIAGLSAVLLSAFIIVIFGVINFNTIRSSEYHIEVPRKSAKIDHLRIAFVADFHLGKGTDIQFVERFTKKIAAIQPDLMIFGGDIVEGHRNDGNLFLFEKLISGIKATYGSYAVLGNHEYYGGQDKGNFFDQAGIKVLMDSIVVIDGSFNLAGRYDSHFSKRKTIGELMKSVKDSLPVILVDHRPTEIDSVSKTTVDVQLSGHTHNGQLFPINLILKRMYRLVWGYEKIGNTNFFVTSGIRLWGPPVRTVGKSEIMVVEVWFK